MNPASIFGFFGLLSFGVFVLVIASGYLTRSRPPKTLVSHPRVSVLKPLKGLDGELEKNLRAVFLQDYPCFEVILGAEDESDPALAIARRVAQAFPNVPSTVLVGAGSSGLNPKVRLLEHLMTRAEGELILISDSNVRPFESYLRELVAEMSDQKADLVHSVLGGSLGRSAFGIIEDLQLSGWVAASVCFTQQGGHPCVIGKSMLMRRSALMELGGLSRARDYLAEDYVLGALFTQAGKRVSLAPIRLDCVSADHGASGFWNRHLRWSQMRRNIAPAFYLGEALVNPTPFLLAAAALSDGVFSALMMAVQLSKWTLELSFIHRHTGRLRPSYFALLPVKDLLILAIWSIAWTKSTIDWRGTRLRIQRGSLLSELAGDSAPSPTTASSWRRAYVGWRARSTPSLNRPELERRAA